MIHSKWIWTFFIILSFVSFCGNSQKLIKGIVVDSASLDGLPGVTIRIQNTNYLTISDDNGIFTLLAKDTDTVTFSFVGYSQASSRVNIKDELMFVCMHDRNIMLSEITVRPNFLYEKFESNSLRISKPLKAAPGGVNFAYFMKEQKERRKLVKVLEELDKAGIYIEFVNDPVVREDIMDRYKITEPKYFELLAFFNQHFRYVMYSGYTRFIYDEMNTYFSSSLNVE